jgi:hypothetical protein
MLRRIVSENDLCMSLPHRVIKFTRRLKQKTKLGVWGPCQRRTASCEELLRLQQQVLKGQRDGMSWQYTMFRNMFALGS